MCTYIAEVILQWYKHNEHFIKQTSFNFFHFLTIKNIGVYSDEMLMLVVYIVLFVILYYLYNFLRWYWIISKIPSPLKSPLLSFFQFTRNPDEIFDSFRKYSKEYYPIYRLSALFVSIIALLDPNDVEKVLASNKHPQKSRIYSFLIPWLGTGLLTSSGQKWQNRRKILTPAFHFNILKNFIEIFNEETKKFLKLLEDNKEQTINLIPLISHFTLNSISETAMGLNEIDPTEQNKYKNAVYKMGEILMKRLAFPLLLNQTIYQFSRLAVKENEIIQILHNFSNNIIQKRKNQQSGYVKRRLLDILLNAKASGEDIDDKGIREEVDTFMFEGHDTTAMAISFTLFTLANHPDIQEKVAEEIMDLIGHRDPSYHDMQELKYTERCVKECLRLYPSVPLITRIAGETFTASSGHVVPQGSIIHLHIFDIHRNPAIYPDPLKFDPDRFLPQNAENRHPFAFIPFSAGPRNCIGQRFAMLEIKAILCGVLRRFRLESLDMNVRFRPDLVLRPRDDLLVRIVPR